MPMYDLAIVGKYESKMSNVRKPIFFSDKRQIEKLFTNLIFGKNQYGLIS